MIVIFDGMSIDLEGTSAYGIIKKILDDNNTSVVIVDAADDFDKSLNDYLTDVFDGAYDGDEVSVCILDTDKQTFEKRIYELSVQETFKQLRDTELTFNLKEGDTDE